jgi:hypothetical protein
MQHRLPLTNGWTVWREVELRSAGFPGAWIDDLADLDLAAAVDGGTLDEERFEQTQRAITRRLREIAGSPLIREAITWQNRRVMHTGIAPLLRHAEGHTNSKLRQKEQLVASYAQRYCCKNERAGFFGASTPARFADEGPLVSVTPGPGLIRRRRTYLEPWAIDALADRLALDPALRLELRPRLNAAVRLDRDVLVDANGTRNQLDARTAALLARCDGATAARAIATDEEAFALLAELAGERIVIWTLEVPTTGDDPEVLLRRSLAELGDAPAVHAARTQLDELVAARDRVADAAGSAERVDAALDALEQTFLRLTGQEGVRHHGEAYAGRTLAGEDCERDVDVVLGPAMRDVLRPLELVLHSARWFTYEIARRYRAAIRTVYDELRGDGPSAVAYGRFYARLPSLFPSRPGPDAIVPQVEAELHGRWREVLGLRGDERVVQRSASELRDRVLDVFAAPGPGWPSARHHSPDVLLAAASVAAANAGDLLAVLGEVHVGMSSHLVPHVPNAAHDPDAPFRIRDLDVDASTAAPVWSRRRTRLDFYSRSPRDFDVETSTARSWRPREQVLQLAQLVLDLDGDRLVVRTHDRRQTFDVIAFLEHYLVGAAFSEFTLLSGDSVPRVTIDRVVVSRARRRSPASDVAFAHAATPLKRFVAARAWAAALGLPRRVFIKVPEETKPLFVDFASPIFVELAARMIRKASLVTVSEMLPDLDQLYLVDDRGATYTSELRIVAVDPQPWDHAR